MTRRSMLSLLAVLPGLASLASSRELVGPMTLERERSLSARGIKVSVLVDGVDVTNRCQYADDTPGQQCARLLRRDAHGNYRIDHATGEIARDTVTSGVVIRMARRA